MNENINKLILEAYRESILTEKDNSRKIMKLGFSQEIAQKLRDLTDDRKDWWLAQQLSNDILKKQNIDIKDSEAVNNLISSQEFTSDLTGIKDWINGVKDNPHAEDISLKDYTFDQAVEASKEWHDSLEASGEQIDLSDEEGAEIIHKFDDGWYWVDLHTAKSTKEGERASHCGTTHIPNGTLLSLRDPRNNPKVTIASTQDYKTFAQIKGNQNRRPHNKYDKYIVDLINELKVSNYKPEYAPSQDFQPFGIKDRKLREKLKKGNPDYVQSVTDVIENNSALKYEYLRNDDTKGFANLTSEELGFMKKQRYYPMDEFYLKGVGNPPRVDANYFKVMIQKSDKMHRTGSKYVLDTPEVAYYYLSYTLRNRTPHKNILLDAISKDSDYSYKYAKDLLKQDEEVPEKIVDGISKDSFYSYSYAKVLLVDNDKEVPEKIVDIISKNSMYSYNYAIDLLDKDKEVPEKIVDAISKDDYDAYYKYARYLLDEGKEVPEKIIDAISKDRTSSYYYAKVLLDKGKKVPEKIVDGVSKSGEYSYNYAEYLLKRDKEVPEKLIDGISKSGEYSSDYAGDLLKRDKEVPEKLIDAISKGSDASYYYASALLDAGKEVPEKIVDVISKNSRSSRYYAEDLLKRDEEVPEKIVDAISKGSDSSYKYAIYLLYEGKEVPEKIVDAISKHIEYSYKYTKDLLKQDEEVPEKIVDGISKYSSRSYNYARDLLDKGKEVPVNIIDSISKYSKYSYSYAKYLLKQDKEVPEKIKKAAEEYKNK